MSAASYVFQTGKGFNPYLLNTIGAVYGEGNVPAHKINNLGFLKMLAANDPISLNRQSNQGEGIQYVQVKYKKRLGKENVGSDDTCTKATVNPWNEQPVPLNVISSLPIFIDDAVLENYANDVLQYGSIPSSMPVTDSSYELVELIMAGANALLEDHNLKLLNNLIIGTNPNTGSNASKTINIDKDITQLSLTDGITELLADCQRALFSGTTQLVGGGLLANYFWQQFAKTGQFNGLLTPEQAAVLDFYYDQDAPSVLATNDFVAIAEGAVKLVEFNRFVGQFAGLKGTSNFGRLMLPIQTGQPSNPAPISFDFQLKYLDCPDQVANLSYAYGSGNLSGTRGWQLILTKYSGLLQLPQDAYSSGDFLANSNGVMRYTLTNS